MCPIANSLNIAVTLIIFRDINYHLMLNIFQQQFSKLNLSLLLFENLAFLSIIIQNN